jgi:hypothetical protein
MATRTDSSNFVKADAFVNVSITGKDGTIHRLKVGIPLHADRKLDAAIIAAPSVLADALKDGRVSMSVHVMGQDDGKTIVL